MRARARSTTDSTNGGVIAYHSGERLNAPPAGRRFSGFVDKLLRREVEGTFHHQSIAALEPLADPAGVIARSVDEAKLIG